MSETCKECTVPSKINKVLYILIAFATIFIFSVILNDATGLNAARGVKLPLFGIELQSSKIFEIGPIIIIFLTLCLHIFIQDWYFCDKKLDEKEKCIARVDFIKGNLIRELFFFVIPPLILFLFYINSRGKPQHFITGACFLAGTFFLLYLRLLYTYTKKLIYPSIAIALFFSVILAGFYFYNDYLNIVKIYPLDLRGADLKGQILIKPIHLEFMNAEGAHFDDSNFAGNSLEGAFGPHAVFKNANLFWVNFYNANFGSAKFKDANLNETIIEDAQFTCAVFEGAQLIRAGIKGTNFEAADFTKADLTKALILDASFNSATLEEAKFRDAIISNTKFIEANLNKAKFQNAVFDDPEQVRDKIEYSNFKKKTEFSKATVSTSTNFHKAELKEAEFKEALLFKTDFSKAKLFKTDFSDAKLKKADFRGAELKGVDMSRSDLEGAIFTEAIFEGVILKGAVLSDSIDLTPEQIKGSCGDDYTQIIEGVNEGKLKRSLKNCEK
jgi:uncharacterized protein YjbI with pentapeptide repeats